MVGTPSGKGWLPTSPRSEAWPISELLVPATPQDRRRTFDVHVAGDSRDLRPSVGAAIYRLAGVDHERGPTRPPRNPDRCFGRRATGCSCGSPDRSATTATPCVRCHAVGRSGLVGRPNEPSSSAATLGPDRVLPGMAITAVLPRDAPHMTIRRCSAPRLSIWSALG